MIKHCFTEQVKLWSNATKQEEQYLQLTCAFGKK